MGIDRIHVVIRNLNSMQNVCSVLCIDRGQRKSETTHWKHVKRWSEKEEYQKDFPPNQSRGKRFRFLSHSIKFLLLPTKASRKGRKKDNGIH